MGMVTDVGGLGDQSFNDGAYQGLLDVRNRLGAHVAVLQSRAAADYQSNLTVFADQDYGEIVGIGYLMARDMLEVAQRYPNRHFAIIDSDVPAPNVASVSFREEQGSFLAGALAAMVTKTKTIAFLGGIDIPLLRKFEAGFTAGAHQIDPSINVLVKYAGSFADVAGGKELGNVLFSQNADIIFVAAGRTGVGAIDAVRSRRDDYIIGVDTDQDGLVPGKILTSMVKRVDVAVFKLGKDAAAHHPDRGNVVLGLRESAVGLTRFTYTHAIVTPPLVARLTALREAIIAGKIDVPSTRAELAHWKPQPL